MFVCLDSSAFTLEIYSVEQDQKIACAAFFLDDDMQ